MRKRLLLLFTSAILAGGMVFAACDDDDDDGIIEDTQTEVSDIFDDDETPTNGETPGAGGAETPALDCPTFEPGETPEADATIPAGCPTPPGDTGDDDNNGS